MIRNTLSQTKLSTFCVLLPDPNLHGMPRPTGTGFFISGDGWFVTAAHVITEDNRSDGAVRRDLNKAWLQKESRFEESGPGAMCQFVSFGCVIPECDFALLKVDFEKNSNKHWLKGRSEFPFSEVSTRKLQEGEPVYSFGYPLSNSTAQKVPNGVIGHDLLSPRTTSAIVASTLEVSGGRMSTDDPRSYVLDKALNYGNSGGPIVATGTGKVHGFCSRFQPLAVPQHHLPDGNGNPTMIMMPSLYGIVSSLGDPRILQILRTKGVPLSNS